jgi:hypothetical protein
MKFSAGGRDVHFFKAFNQFQLRLRFRLSPETRKLLPLRAARKTLDLRVLRTILRAFEDLTGYVFVPGTSTYHVTRADHA